MGLRIVCLPGDVPVATDARWARRAGERVRGLIRQPPLTQGEALVLRPAKQVHTFGVAQPIDVVFCDAQWKVIHVVRALKPRRVTRWVSIARYVVELPGGSLPPEVKRGSSLQVIEA